ncbi:MAG: carboxypeptidase regulatory-like domain-containing protein [Candidatus Pacebacteria bacterium]|nr:carboxypeptidase regulatory-like domain-containing protein [Candidatus Paceibacterota bacterium]
MKFQRTIIKVFATLGFFLPIIVSAGTIDASNYKARLCENEDCSTYSVVYWRTTNGTAVTVTTSGLTGYIWSEDLGWINLAPTNSGVLNTSAGVLSGYAWGSTASWVNFDTTNSGVTINTSTGEFSGYAWVSSGGWMKFDCAIADACVKTDWRPSSGTAGGGGNAGGGIGGGGTTTTGGGGTTTTGDGDTGTTGGDTTTTGGDTTTTGGDTTTTGGDTGTTGGDTGTTGGGDGGGTTTGGGGTTGGTTGTGGGGDPCPEGTTTNILGQVVGQVKDTFCETKEATKSAIADIKKIIQSKEGDIIAIAISTTGVIAGASLTIATSLFLNPLSFSEIFLIPARLWSLLMAAVGLKKRRRPWGTVYDSITKQPLDPAYVTLRTMEGVEVTSSITDLDGRFGFVVPAAGHYMIYAQKTNYVFPSQKLVGYDHDELYRDLYFGEHFFVANAGDVIIKNVPMDPEKFDWNEFAKKQQNLMRFYSKRDKILRRISDIFFAVGFVVSSLATIAAPKTYNIIIFSLYVTLFFIRRHGAHSRPYGDITDVATGNPVSFGIIRIASAATGVEVMHRIADAKGRYYALLPNGEYKIRIDRKLPDGKYQTVAKDLPATVSNGYLSKTFLINTAGLSDVTPPTPPSPPVPPTPPTPSTPPASPLPPTQPTPPSTPPQVPVSVPKVDPLPKESLGESMVGNQPIPIPVPKPTEISMPNPIPSVSATPAGQ